VQFSLPYNRFLHWTDTSLRYFDTLFAHSICCGDRLTTRSHLYVRPNVSYSKIPNWFVEKIYFWFVSVQSQVRLQYMRLESTVYKMASPVTDWELILNKSCLVEFNIFHSDVCFLNTLVYDVYFHSVFFLEVHSLFQRELFRECDLMLPSWNITIFSFL
jgi:hypothetical protein